ncbi:MAG: hypothetical protein IKA10_04575 [Oscillospiraceae bacterium]|nr:hypothetical protein [Oscillospiraceae bacterium]
MQDKKNIACRIFKEQIELIQQLPENERAEVLYKAIISAFNQFDNQIENQNENAYVSVSVSDSVSVLSKTVFSLLKKNIVCKEFSNNYGGKRIGAGKKKQTESVTDTTTREESNKVVTGGKEKTPTIEEVLLYAERQNSIAGMGGFKCTPEQATDFFHHYAAQGWVAGNGIPIHNWQHKLREWVKEKYKIAGKAPRMSLKEIKEIENHAKLQKMLKGEL